MAEEDEGGGGPAPAGGSVLKKYGPLAAIVLLVQVVVAWVVIKTLLDPSSSEDRDPGDPLIPQQQVQVAISEEEGSGLPYQHPAEPIKITFNPAETNSERFAVLEIVLGLMATNEEGTLMTPAEVGADAASLALVDANMKLIRRSILRVLREKTIDDLESMNVEEVWKDVKSALNEEVFSKIAWDPDSESKKRVSIQEIIPTAIIVQ